MAVSTNSQELYSLIADVGGTNARLQLIKFHKDASVPNTVASTFFKTEDFTSFRDIVKIFLKEFEGTEQYPNNATLAIAGAVFNNKLRMANLPHWPEMDGDALGEEFNIKPFKFINDFEAVGYSLLKIPKENLVQLNKVQPVLGRPMAVVGSGTGLGECVLNPGVAPDGGVQYFVCPTEGGHKDFAPTDQTDFDYLMYNLNEIEDVKAMNCLSTERAFCGPAVPVMYSFFCKRDGVEQQKLDSKTIFQKGLKNEDPICAKVLQFYARLYGKEVSNFALDCLPYAGIFLVGGMINSVLSFFTSDAETNPFMKAYFNKDKVTNAVLARFPIYVVTYEELGLLGAFVKAQIDAFGPKHVTTEKKE